VTETVEVTVLSIEDVSYAPPSDVIVESGVVTWKTPLRTLVRAPTDPPNATAKIIGLSGNAMD
tara:strand:+ start:927 stop:1115 length:189 start_codon:yes stop_codon:yes gene_type:complete